MAYSFHQHQPSQSYFHQLNDNNYDDYPESMSPSSSNCHSSEYGDSSPFVIPLTPPRIAVNSQLNLLSCLEDTIGPSQSPSWVNASVSLETKDNSVKATAKVTTIIKTKLTIPYRLELLLKEYCILALCFRV